MNLTKGKNNTNEYQLSRPDIATIIDFCNDLGPDEKLVVFEFGKNCDLVLHIYKDEDYNKETGEYNLVTISTATNGKWVDDTYDTHVTNGSLYKELQRINEYENFSTR